jgi:hypothetical protein
MAGALGTYAVSTSNGRSWVDSPVIVKTKARKTKNAGIVINQVFSECAKITSDPYWIGIFNAASLGKLPKKFVFKDSQLGYKKGTKLQVTDLPLDPYEAYYVAVNFFRHHGGMASDRDQEAARNDLEIRSSIAEANQDEIISWSKVGKTMKDILLSNYIEDLATHMGLNAKEKSDLNHIIKIGRILGYFGKDNIQVIDRRITTIDGLIFDNVNRSFQIDSSLKPKATKPTSRKKMIEISYFPTSSDLPSKDSQINFMKQWTKLVDRLDKETRKYRNLSRLSIGGADDPAAMDDSVESAGSGVYSNTAAR